MDFQLNADQVELQEAARRFAREVLPPLAQELEETNQAVPHDMVKRLRRTGALKP